MKHLFFSLAVLFLTACHAKQEPGSMKDEAMMATDMTAASEEAIMEMEAPRQAAATEATPAPVERKLIRTGSIRFEVSDLDKTKAEISAVVNRLGGYISSENSSNYGAFTEQNMQVRVPAARFDTLLVLVEAQAKKIESRTVNAQDVTEEFIDIQARLQTKQELEKRYSELLKVARNLEEILSIERELESVRAEIESMQGRLNYLSKQVSFSTLDITFFVPSSTSAPSFFYELARGFGDGWDNLLGFIIGLVHIWPFLLLAALAVFGWIRWAKRGKKG